MRVVVQILLSFLALAALIDAGVSHLRDRQPIDGLEQTIADLEAEYGAREKRDPDHTESHLALTTSNTNTTTQNPIGPQPNMYTCYGNPSYWPVSMDSCESTFQHFLSGGDRYEMLQFRQRIRLTGGPCYLSLYPVRWGFELNTTRQVIVDHAKSALRLCTAMYGKGGFWTPNERPEDCWVYSVSGTNIWRGGATEVGEEDEEEAGGLTEIGHIKTGPVAGAAGIRNATKPGLIGDGWTG